MLNKVPEVTLYFWVIKIMCTTVGETAADYLNVHLGWGLTNTTYFTGALLAAILLVQFRLRRYVPVVYWAVVVVISVFVVVLGLVVVGTIASFAATAALGLVSFVPFAGLAAFPLQAVAWLVRGLLFQLLGLAALGIVIGSGAALAATRWVESLLFGLRPQDPLTIGLAALLLLSVASIAGYLPARRASRVYPMVALRCE